MSAKGCEGGKTGCENGQRHIFHHLLTHTVIRVNFGMVPTSDKRSAPLRLCMLGKGEGSTFSES